MQAAELFFLLSSSLSSQSISLLLLVSSEGRRSRIVKRTQNEHSEEWSRERRKKVGVVEERNTLSTLFFSFLFFSPPFPKRSYGHTLFSVKCRLIRIFWTLEHGFMRGESGDREREREGE